MTDETLTSRDGDGTDNRRDEDSGETATREVRDVDRLYEVLHRLIKKKKKKKHKGGKNIQKKTDRTFTFINLEN